MSPSCKCTQKTHVTHSDAWRLANSRAKSCQYESESPPPFSACVGSVWPSSGLRKVPLTKPGQSRFQSTPNKSTNMAHMVTWHGVQTLVKFMGFYLLHWLPYIALEALALIYLFGWPQCIPPGCISFQFVTSNMLTCPNPTREIPNTSNKSGKTVGLTTLHQIVSGVLVLFDFFGFPGNNFGGSNFFCLGSLIFLEIHGWTQHSCQALSASLLHLLRPNVLVPGQPGAVQSLIHPRKRLETKVIEVTLKLILPFQLGVFWVPAVQFPEGSAMADHSLKTLCFLLKGHSATHHVETLSPK